MTSTIDALLVFEQAFQRPLIGASAAYLLMLAADGLAPILACFLGARIWQPIAALSYSLYLLQEIGHVLIARPIWQGTFAQVLDKESQALSILALFAGAALWTLSSVPLALLSYILVERPGMLLGRCVTTALVRRPSLPK